MCDLQIYKNQTHNPTPILESLIHYFLLLWAGKTYVKPTL